MNIKIRWLTVGVFAGAMAWVESAVVYYLRTMINRIDPYQPLPLPDVGGFGLVEIIREAATMIMLVTIGVLAGRTWRGRFGFSLIAFGMWDIFYYVFLRMMAPWPKSIFDWDILFLIPLPWWGPVWSPISIAALMIVFGLLATVLEQGKPPLWPRLPSTLVCMAGISLALYVFMADAVKVASEGTTALRNLLPTQFQTGLFFFAWALIAAPVVEMSWQLFTRYRDYLPSGLADAAQN